MTRLARSAGRIIHRLLTARIAEEVTGHPSEASTRIDLELTCREHARERSQRRTCLGGAVRR